VNIAIPNRSVVWILDYDERLRTRMEEIAKQTGAFVDVVGYNNLQGAAESIGAAEIGDLPRILVSDHIGFERTARCKPVAESLRQKSPTSMIVLHSNSAYDDPRTVPNLRKQRRLDRDVPKTIFADEFANLLKTWSDRWERDVSKKMRDYIRTCPDPMLEYFDDYELGSLSLVDIYRQIVAGTDLGLEQEKVWEQLLINAPNHSY